MSLILQQLNQAEQARTGRKRDGATPIIIDRRRAYKIRAGGFLSAEHEDHRARLSDHTRRRVLGERLLEHFTVFGKFPCGGELLC